MSPLVHPWTRPPAPGTTTLVAPGIQWLRMPLPFALNHINLWLLEDEHGWAIVDTGIGLDDTRTLWEAILARALGGKPVTRIVVTHFHPDHMGNAGWLTDRFGVPLECTEGEWGAAQYATRLRMNVERRLDHYRRHGFDEATVEGFRRRGNHYPRVVPTLAREFARVADGDVFAIGPRRWRVITVRGHAPEHACLWSAEDRVLIAGDQVLPKITTNISVWPEFPDDNPLRLYLDSLARFDPMDADTLVLPSHGLPFRGLHPRLAQLRQHHDARLDETLEALAEPKTGSELIPILFRRDIDVHQLAFAIGEVLAHIKLLESDGSIARVSNGDGVERFRRV